jgi:hypothetical protein
MASMARAVSIRVKALFATTRGRNKEGGRERRRRKENGGRRKE